MLDIVCPAAEGQCKREPDDGDWGIYTNAVLSHGRTGGQASRQERHLAGRHQYYRLLSFLHITTIQCVAAGHGGGKGTGIILKRRPSYSGLPDTILNK
jgi:hypothetical protein